MNHAILVIKLLRTESSRLIPMDKFEATIGQYYQNVGSVASIKTPFERKNHHFENEDFFAENTKMPIFFGRIFF